MFWDNEVGKRNLLVHPDPYMFFGSNSKNSPFYLSKCAEEHKVKWEDKESKAYFLGGLAGTIVEGNDD